jgi:hypothetical protein
MRPRSLPRWMSTHRSTQRRSRWGRNFAVGGGVSPGLAGVFPAATFAFEANSDLLGLDVQGRMMVRFDTGSEVITTRADVSCLNVVGTLGGGGTAEIWGGVTRGTGTVMSFSATDSGQPGVPDTWGFHITAQPIPPPTECIGGAGPQAPVERGQNSSVLRRPEASRESGASYAAATSRYPTPHTLRT